MEPDVKYIQIIKLKVYFYSERIKSETTEVAGVIKGQYFGNQVSPREG